MPLPTIFRRKTAGKGLPPGERIYAIGDIHGRLDLYEDLMARIDRDVATRPPLRTRRIILGDFIDRGPQSAALVARLMTPARDLVILKGNHEAALVAAAQGDHDAAEMWANFGGVATLASFGVPFGSIDPDNTAALIGLIRGAIPPHVLTWLGRLRLSISAGGYYFVHAGVRPGVPLRQQADADKLWIRERFTDSTADHGAIIVHGHSIHEPGLDIAPNRIGVDTGAYRTNRLSAVGLEGDAIWAITTGD